MPPRIPVLLGMALLATAPPLAAQTWEDPPIHVGIQATGAFPAQDLKGMVGKRGLGGGIFFEQDLDEDVRVRVRFDYVSFSQGTVGPRNQLPSFLPPTALAMEADQTALGFDVRYAPAPLHGAFLLGGLSASRMEFQTLIPGAPGTTTLVRTKEKTSTKPCLALGLGYRITQALSLTSRYTTFSVNGVSLSSVEAGLDFRF